MALIKAGPVRFVIHPDSAYALAVITGLMSLRFGLSQGIAVTAVLVFSMLLHEMGHAVTAYGCNVPVSEIGFCGKGAYLCRRKAAGITEALIAAAGPLVNLLLFDLFSMFAPSSDLFRWASVGNAVMYLYNLAPLRGTDGYRLLATLREIRCRPNVS